MHDIWERYWDTYSMIIDDYKMYPDQDVIIVWPAENDQDNDGGSGKMSTGASGSEDNSKDKD